MFPKENRREGRSGRPRRRPGRIAVEGLETRQLLTYSALGYSLPNLQVTGYAAQVAAWGGSFAVNVTVQNQGASSLIEPTHLAPTATDPDTGAVSITPSTADSVATTVDVFASTRPNATTGLVEIDTIQVPSITQNSQYTTSNTFTLPSRPKGFPTNGGKIYVTFIVEGTQSASVLGQYPAYYHVPLPTKIVNPLPNLQVVVEDVPASLQPGDVISPTIRIANLGAGNPSTQGAVTVDLVASLDKNFGPGDSVLASYTIQSLPGLAQVPTQSIGSLFSNLIPPANVNTTTLAPFKLPASPGFYYIGIEIDPTSSIHMTHPPTPALMGVLTVGPPSAYLPSANLLVNTSGTVPTFPELPSKVIGPTF